MQRFILSQFFQKIMEVIITYEDSGSRFIDVPGRFLVFQKPPDDFFSRNFCQCDVKRTQEEKRRSYQKTRWNSICIRFHFR